MMQAIPSAPKGTRTKYWDGVGTLTPYTFVKGASDTEITTMTNALTEQALGVIQDTTIEAAHAAQIPLSIVDFGWTFVVADGTFTEGKLAKVGNTGMVQNATPSFDGSEQIVGFFGNSGSSGDLAWVFVMKIYVP
jgi:hypothetical protein